MKYQIAAAARLSNLSIDTIRAWERRYEIVRPERGEARVRLYSDGDVARLSLARMATQLGHPIRRVAKLTNKELEALVHREPLAERSLHGGVVDKVIAAVHENDAAQAERVLISAALLVPARELVLDVLAPLLREIGQQWENGLLSIWQEHLVSSLVRKSAAVFPRPESAGPPIIFATPPFEEHEFGITLSAILAGSHGKSGFVLGTSMPCNEIAEAVRRLNAHVLVVGMTLPSTPVEVAQGFTRELDAALPPDVEVWLGGSLGAHVASMMDSKRIRGVGSLEEFDRLCQVAA